MSKQLPERWTMALRVTDLRSGEQVSSATLPLKNAVLCMDCECVSTSRCDECPVCGGHSLLALAGMIGGTLRDHRKGPEIDRPVLFDLEITIEMKNLEGQRLSNAIERISSLVTPSLGEEQASCHIRVEPVARPDEERAAA